MTVPIKNSWITLPFGAKNSRYRLGYHTGDDWHAPTGTQVHATRGGKVVFVGVSGGWGRAYGTHIIIGGRRGIVRMAYCHLSRVFVRTGALVDEGDVIGESGATGMATAPHLHFEERIVPFSFWLARKPRSY